jgi:hypothetical protein
MKAADFAAVYRVPKTARFCPLIEQFPFDRNSSSIELEFPSVDGSGTPLTFTPSYHGFGDTATRSGRTPPVKEIHGAEIIRLGPIPGGFRADRAHAHRAFEAL